MNKKEEQQKCKNCDMSVGFSYVPKTFCSERCRDIFKRKTGYYKGAYRKKHPKIFLKICFVCHAKFEPRQNGVKYCSKKCSMLGQRVKSGKPIKIGIPLEVYRKVRILGLL